MEKDNHELNQNLKLVAKTSMIVLISLIICKLLNYVYRIIIARRFGPEIYGFYAIALMIFGLFGMFSMLGIPEGTIRYISYYRGKENQKKIKTIFTTSLKILPIMGILVGILMFFSSEFLAINIFHNLKLTIFFKLFSIAIPFFAVSRVFLGTMRGFEKVHQNSLIDSVAEPLTKTIFLILLIFFGIGYSFSIGISSVLGAFATLLFSYLFCRLYLFKYFIDVKTKKDKKLTKELLKYSLPLLFSTAIIYIFGWTDTFLIGYLKSANEVGIYNAALPISLLLTLTPLLFTPLFFPLVTKEYSKKNISVIKELTQQIGKWIFIINLPALFFFLFFPNTVINILFGKEYLQGGICLIFLSLGFFIQAQTEVSLSLLAMMKKSKLRLFNIILTLIIAIILHWYLIPLPKIFLFDNSNGILGASIATMLSLFFYAFLILTQAYYYIKIIPIRRKMLNVLFSCIIAGSVLLIIKHFIKINLFILVLLGILFMSIYILLLFLTKALDKNDLMIINSIKNKLFLKN